MIRKLLTYLTFPIIFVWLLISSYISAKPKYKPDSAMELLTDPSWLYDWPKWLDIPLMKWINDGFKVWNLL
jgi:glycine betaine/proline transport system permease protein